MWLTRASRLASGEMVRLEPMRMVDGRFWWSWCMCVSVGLLVPAPLSLLVSAFKY